MTTQAQAQQTRLTHRTTIALTLIVAAVVSVIANSLVALAGMAAGAGNSFAPLMIAVYGPFTVLGLVVGYIGWRIVRSRSANPLRALRLLVPVLLVLSFIPDTISLAAGFIPGTTVTGFVALMIMHVVVVVAVGVPVFQRLSPVGPKAN